METGITGLEQYSLERAGYFVRRGILDRIAWAEVTPETAPRLPEIASIMDDLGRNARLHTCLFLASATRQPTTWKRDFDVDPYQPSADQLARLHCQSGGYWIRLALSADSSLVVIPGSHADPCPADRADNSAMAEDAVRLRLDLGDAVILSSGLLRREDPQPDSSGDVLLMRVETGS